MQPIALYVHIPFCETKCPYCDFNTYAKIESLIPDYVAALRTEIELWGGLLDSPAVRAVFFGGGTPSYLPSGDISALMATISGSFALQDDAEITLEANPGDFTPDKLNWLLDAGINRLSIGVQSFDDGLLCLLGRRHTASDAIDAYRMAYDAGFDNVSIDLMYGLPHQTVDHWQETLARTADLHPLHVSLYALTLEGGTPMEHSVSQGTLPTPDPDLAADMYALAEHDLGALGYRHYEISNWADDGKLGLHNIVYWRNEPYLGVGPGAHSSIANHRFSNIKPPREYVKRLQEHSGSSGSLNGSREDDYAAIRSIPVVDTIEFIDRPLEMAETMMLGLRLDTGVSISEFEARFGASPLDAYREELDELQPTGLIETVDGSIRLTDRGRFLSNEVFVRFFD
ncbi:MAG: radical SAM family heme chaperone HemW [Dehalococcoidia bacterium]|nr:radical SAM family heme chaperone HemW [Dehalococcoidia bacterium]